ncbi:uncharacterized protein si:dkey-106l3.7 [Hoplias malabaricus]|uniref:uncharacterized protein si:dkey-106l3.7 n=1 Tax=Hoplias malabaricus TaxID=27720 RepID=UPI00346211D5
MNLYRNFGSMLENWVADGYPEASCFSEGKLHNASSIDSGSADSIRVPGTTLRSESEDSGVDLSHVGSPKTSRSSVLTSEDSLTFKPVPKCEAEEDLKPSASSPTSSLCSSSSSCFSVTQASQNGSSEGGRPSVDRVLRTNESNWTEATESKSLFQDKSQDVRIRRRCNTTSLTRGLHTAADRIPHRSRTESVGSRRPQTQSADQHRQIPSPQQHNLTNGDPAEDSVFDRDPDSDALSPGLLYLEQLCRMLENIARLQRQNQSLQLEMDAIHIQRGHPHRETVSSQKSEKHCADDPSTLSSPFRRRTASDTWAFLRHRRKAKPQSEQFGSTDVLQEEPYDSLQEPLESEPGRTSSNLKQKMSSLRKNEKSQHSRSHSLYGERSLMKLFRNRRKTTHL